MYFISAVPGFWCDYYCCREDNITETIEYMLQLHSEDLPNTRCVGLTITHEGGSMYKIWPKVFYNSRGIICDYFSGEITNAQALKEAYDTIMD